MSTWWTEITDNVLSSQVLSVSILAVGPTILFGAIFCGRTTFSSSTLRITAFLSIAASNLYAFQNSAFTQPLCRYMSALLSIYHIFWSAVLLLCHDPTSEFKRIALGDDGGYVWEGYPQQSYSRRFFWTLDLVTNFRCVGWKHGTTQYPVPVVNEVGVVDEAEKRKKQKQKPDQHSKAWPSSLTTPVEFLGLQTKLFLASYAMLDIGVLLMSRDAYFGGKLDLKSTTFDAESSRGIGSTYLTFSRRLVLAMLFVYNFLNLFRATLGLVVGVSLLLIGGKSTWQQAWMYPSPWGRFRSIAVRGIAGMNCHLRDLDHKFKH